MGFVGVSKSIMPDTAEDDQAPGPDLRHIGESYLLRSNSVTAIQLIDSLRLTIFIDLPEPARQHAMASPSPWPELQALPVNEPQPYELNRVDSDWLRPSC